MKNSMQKISSIKRNKMKLTDINIRDPYILCSGDWYYMYGTRAETCWGAAEGFDCFKSKDLENWEGPFEIFHKPEDFC